MDREIEKTTDEESYEWGVSCLYSDKSTRFRRKGEFVEKEAWVEVLSLLQLWKPTMPNPVPTIVTFKYVEVLIIMVLRTFNIEYNLLYSN